MTKPTIHGVARERAANCLLFASLLVLAAAILSACQGTAAGAAIDRAPQVAGGLLTIAAAWIAALQESGAITPEQAAQFGSMMGGVQNSMDSFLQAIKATATAIGQIRGEVAAAKAAGPDTTALVGTGVGATVAAVAAVQKLRGPSATTEERVKRRAAK